MLTGTVWSTATAEEDDDGLPLVEGPTPVLVRDVFFFVDILKHKFLPNHSYQRALTVQHLSKRVLNSSFDDDSSLEVALENLRWYSSFVLSRTSQM